MSEFENKLIRETDGIISELGCLTVYEAITKLKGGQICPNLREQKEVNGINPNDKNKVDNSIKTNI